MDKAQASLMLNAKSTGIGILLTLLFGGFGLLYSHGVGFGSIVASIIQIGVIFMCFLLFGFIIAIPWHIICAFLAMGAIKRHNQELISSLPD